MDTSDERCKQEACLRPRARAVVRLLDESASVGLKSNGGVTPLHIANGSNEWRQIPEAMVPTVVPSASEAPKEPQVPADFARVRAEWERLPDAVKAAILALIRAAQE